MIGNIILYSADYLTVKLTKSWYFIEIEEKYLCWRGRFRYEADVYFNFVLI